MDNKKVTKPIGRGKDLKNAIENILIAYVTTEVGGGFDFDEVVDKLEALIAEREKEVLSNLVKEMIKKFGDKPLVINIQSMEKVLKDLDNQAGEE